MPITAQVLYQSTPMTVDVYTHQEYPKMLFHPDGRLLIVEDQAAETTAAGEGWVKSPAEYGVETCPQAAAAVPGGFLARGYVAPVPVAVAEVPATPPPVATTEEESSSSSRRR